MSYNDDLTWDALSRDAQNAGRQLKTALLGGLEAYNEWQSYRAGRTNADIATALGAPVTEAWVVDLDSAFSAGKELYDYADNQTPSQGDRLYSIRKFS